MLKVVLKNNHYQRLIVVVTTVILVGLLTTEIKLIYDSYRVRTKTASQQSEIVNFSGLNKILKWVQRR